MKLARAEAIPAVGCTSTGRTQFAEATEFAALLVILAAVPLFLHQSQLLTGTVVNGALALGGLRLSCRYKLAALILVPSAAAVAGTGLLGSVSFGLLALMAAIWVANLTYVLTIRHSAGYYPLALLRATLAKVGIMFIAAAVLVSSGMLPISLLAIIPMAFLTALLGGSIAGALDKFLLCSSGAK